MTILRLAPDPRPAPVVWELPPCPPEQEPLPVRRDNPAHLIPRTLTARPVSPQVPALVIAVVEVLSGRRAVSTIRTRLSERVGRRLDVVTPRHGLRIGSMRCQLADDVAEVVVRLDCGRRAHALALRLEQRGRRWVVTALEGA